MAGNAESAARGVAGSAKRATGDAAGAAKSVAGGVLKDVAVDRLKSEAGNMLGALGSRALSSLQERVHGATQRLTEYAGNGGGPGLTAALTGAKKAAEGESPGRSALSAGMTAVKETAGKVLGRGDHGGKGKNLKVTNIEESIDVGAPVRLVYDQWTQFADFPSFMKKVESVQQESDEKLNWRAQILWSHRSWESTILRQVPDEEIIWRSKGPKGSVDGTVTFHEIAPRLTRILLALEYHPQGFFEQTGNLWRAQGRRARLELKHFRRHVMSQLLLHPEEVEGWRGAIEDGEVVKDHETALEEERQREEERSASGEEREAEDEYGAEEGEEYPEEQDEYPQEQEGAYEEDRYAEEESDFEEEDGNEEEVRGQRAAGRQPSRHDRGGEQRGEEGRPGQSPRRVTRRAREKVSR